ncbi:hypothetical protein GW916_12355 [bacterium]|nr:hypothetical protein [bacterium]
MEKKDKMMVCLECGWIKDFEGWWRNPDDKVSVIIKDRKLKEIKVVCPDCQISRKRTNFFRGQ